MIFNLFRSNPEREARRLNKDALDVLDLARHTYKESILGEIARITRDGVRQMQDIAGENEALRAREIDRYKVLHREARRQQNQTRLTAYTLIIIHGEGLKHGELTAPTRAAIDEFLDEWPATDPPEGTLPG